MTDQERYHDYVIAVLRSPALPALIRDQDQFCQTVYGAALAFLRLEQGVFPAESSEPPPPPWHEERRPYVATCSLTASEQPSVSAAVQERSEMPVEDEYEPVPEQTEEQSARVAVAGFAPGTLRAWVGPRTVPESAQGDWVSPPALDEPPLSERPPAYVDDSGVAV